MQDPAIIRGLYAITPDRTDDDLLISQVEQVINGGVKLIQYRAKTIGKNQKKIQASALKELCDKRNVRLIINDDIELSMHLDTFGVHLGKDDDTINKARKILGPKKCIGVSCYNSIDRAKKANKNMYIYDQINSLVPKFLKSLKEGNLKLCGKILSKNWELKKSLDKDIYLNHFKEIEKKLDTLNVYGYKLLGAGSGGYYCVISSNKTKKKLQKLFGNNFVSVKFDKLGVREVKINV